MLVQRLNGKSVIIGQQLTINLGVLELPSWDTVVKEDINLPKGPVFGFWETKPAPDVAK